MKKKIFYIIEQYSFDRRVFVSLKMAARKYSFSLWPVKEENIK